MCCTHYTETIMSMKFAVTFTYRQAKVHVLKAAQEKYLPKRTVIQYCMHTVCFDSGTQAHFSSPVTEFEEDSADISQLNGIMCHYTTFRKVYCSGVKRVLHHTDLAVFQNTITPRGKTTKETNCVFRKPLNSK